MLRRRQHPIVLHSQLDWPADDDDDNRSVSSSIEPRNMSIYDDQENDNGGDENMGPNANQGNDGAPEGDEAGGTDHLNAETQDQDMEQGTNERLDEDDGGGLFGSDEEDEASVYV